MAAKSVVLSVRINDEDAAFLSELSLPGATTPSDKVRALIAKERQKKIGTEDPAGCLDVMDGLLGGVRKRVGALEREQGVHSEFVSRLLAWLPETVCLAATGLSTGTAEPKDAAQWERLLADRAALLIEAVLQLALTKAGRTYDPELLAKRLGPSAHLALLLDLAPSKE